MAKKRKAKRKPKRSKEREKFIGFHAPLLVSTQLNVLAKAQDRPVSSVLRKVVNDYLVSNELVLKEAAESDKPEEKEKKEE